ncbi:MAG TPA: GNAT family N-acetyltransferase [Gemmatimonadaceae bacterium]|jgi:Predicted acetyltransferase
MPANLLIRPATLADIPALTTIAHSAKRAWGYPASWLDLWAPQLTITEVYLRDHIVFVAERDETVVGFAALDCDDGTQWQLDHLWVSPEHWLQGIGGQLLTSVLVELRYREVSELHIEADPHAAPFYTRMGAQLVGATPAPMPGMPDRELPLFALTVAAT